MLAHVLQPEPDQLSATTDYNCPHRAGGRRCGSYHAVAAFTEFYGLRHTCCSCGRSVTDGFLGGGRQDPAKVRERFEALRRAG